MGYRKARPKTAAQRAASRRNLAKARAARQRAGKGAASATARRSRGGRTAKRRTSAERAAGVRWGAEAHRRVGSTGRVTKVVKSKDAVFIGKPHKSTAEFRKAKKITQYLLQKKPKRRY